MTEQEIQQNNLLIAEYMMPDWRNAFKSGDIKIDNIPDGEIQTHMALYMHYEEPKAPQVELRYHLSWCELMPVIKKLTEQLKDPLYITYWQWYYNNTSYSFFGGDIDQIYKNTVLVIEQIIQFEKEEKNGNT